MIKEYRLVLEMEDLTMDWETAFKNTTVEVKAVNTDDKWAKHAAEKLRMKLARKSRMLEYLLFHVQSKNYRN